MPFFVPVTLTSKLVQASKQTRFPREFGTNPFSSKNVTTKTYTLKFEFIAQNQQPVEKIHFSFSCS